jgi:tetratricopeptide (TPR) repeat protein
MWRASAGLSVLILLIALPAAPALAQPSEHVADYVAQGVEQLDAKNYPAALDLFTKAVAADPKDYAAHFHRALSYSLMDKFAEAIPEYKITLELRPDLYDAEINLGMCLLRVKDAAAAVGPFERASAQKPKEFRPTYYLGMARLESHDFGGAATAFAAAIALNPSSAGAELGLGQAMVAQGHPEDAEPHYRKAGQLDPTYKDDLLQLGELYEKAGHIPQAIAIYRDFPDNPGAKERMGALLSESGDAAAGIPALESAVETSPTAANRLALAQAYVKTKQPAKAIPLAAKALEAAPDDYELRLFYGRLLRDQHKLADAAPQFLAASKLKPDAVQPWNELAGVMVMAEQYPQALAALDRVKALGGETTGHYYLRAISYDHLHQLKEALANYNKFLEESKDKNPDDEFKARQRARIIQNELNRK